MFRRIAAACALLAVMALGFAAPAETGSRQDGAAASASSLDTTLVAASTRRLRARDGGAEIDGRPAGRGHGPLAPFHPLWLTAAAISQPPPVTVELGAVLAPSRAPSALVLASRTSRGPPRRS